MCQKTSISVYGNLRVFLMFCPPGGRGSGRPGVGGLGGRSPPMETPPDEDWEFVWVPLHAWAEIRSSPKIPLSTIAQPLRADRERDLLVDFGLQPPAFWTKIERFSWFWHILGPRGLKQKMHTQRSRSLLISDRSATTGGLDGSIFLKKSKIWAPFWAPPWGRRRNNF